ncbi:MAG: Zn-ribbon domain-containing protein [Lachnospiraceae bacterium]|nr:Zn-ribbon domain-containing protein [Lachnospiraceae bacterium]
MKCLRCGFEVLTESGNSEIIVKCPKCGWTAVTTYMSEIEDDLTKYSIFIEQGNSTDRELIKLVSELSGMNFLEARNILLKGGRMVVEYAVAIKEITTKLDMVGIEYHIDPIFPY